MTIKQTGGIFGRNPTFNNVESNSSTVNGILKVSNDHNSEFIHLDSASTTDEAYIRIESTDLVFDTDPSALRPTSKIIFKSDGVDVLEIAGGDQGGDITPLGNVILNDGQGIDFSATSGTGTSELFDDYEEGTWTPTFTSTSASFSYTNQFGSYVKIGGFVSAQFYLNATASGTTSNQVKLSGLPFASANLNAFAQSAGSVWFTGTVNVTPLVSNNAATAVIWKNNTAASNLNAVDVSGHYFVGTVFYRAS